MKELTREEAAELVAKGEKPKVLTRTKKGKDWNRKTEHTLVGVCSDYFIVRANDTKDVKVDRVAIETCEFIEQGFSAACAMLNRWYAHDNIAKTVPKVHSIINGIADSEVEYRLIYAIKDLSGKNKYGLLHEKSGVIVWSSHIAVRKEK